MKFSSILKKIDFNSRKSMLKTGAILFWTDMKRLFDWKMDNFKSNFLSRGQLGSKSNDKFFLSVLKVWQCCKYFFGNLIFVLTARTLSRNRLKYSKISSIKQFPALDWMQSLFYRLSALSVPQNTLSNSFSRVCTPSYIASYQNVNNAWFCFQVFKSSLPRQAFGYFL